MVVYDLDMETTTQEPTMTEATTCTYTEDVWVCENGTLVLHPEAKESFWLHDTSEITACPACGA